VQLVIFLLTFNASYIRLKINVIQRVKRLRIWKQSKQGNGNEASRRHVLGVMPAVMSRVRWRHDRSRPSPEPTRSRQNRKARLLMADGDTACGRAAVGDTDRARTTYGAMRPSPCSTCSTATCACRCRTARGCCGTRPRQQQLVSSLSVEAASYRPTTGSGSF
jgi:hypothetical protein